MRPTLLAASAVLCVAIAAASAVLSPAIAQPKPDDALRAALEESKSSGKGLTFHIKGT
jgi:hypothetical protein